MVKVINWLVRIWQQIPGSYLSILKVVKNVDHYTVNYGTIVESLLVLTVSPGSFYEFTTTVDPKQS